MPAMPRSPLLLLLALPGLACGGSSSSGPTAPASPPAPPAAHQGHGDHGDHGAPGHVHGGGHHGFDDAERWAKVFDDPARDAWQKPDAVVALLDARPGMTVVDIGAGTGYFLARLSRAVGPTGRVIGTDLEPDMVRYMTERAAREGLGNVEARQAPADGPGLAAGSVDRVLIVDVWHHIAERDTYARALAGALRPGGAVMIVDFTAEAAHGPPAAMRLPAADIVATLRGAGLDAAIATESLPDQYVVIGRAR
jgi:SAM-dependent methyltransferase